MEQRRASQDGVSSSSPGPAGADGKRPSSAGAAGSGPSYHFICECFFLTAKGLHLGLIKTITESADVHRVSLHAVNHSNSFLSFRTHQGGQQAISTRTYLAFGLAVFQSITSAFILDHMHPAP